MQVKHIDCAYSTPEEWGFRDIKSIVMHDLEGSTGGAINWWNTQCNASAHYIVSKDGTITETVDPHNVAWHAGTTTQTGRTPFWKTNNINGYSIGIELEGFTTDIYTDKQYDSLIALTGWLTREYKIPPVHTKDRIEGWHLHSDISNQRSDPGPNFDINRVLDAIK